MSDAYQEVVNTTKQYYDSDDAQNFYYKLWGGEDLHLGIYEREDEPIFDASRRTIDRTAAQAPVLDGSVRVLDVGGGFSGSARRLAHTFGCHVTVLNLSERENERARRMNAEQGVDNLINVVDGNFEDIPFDAGHFDIVWSQDAILHSGDREKVVSEVSRVLKQDGRFIFTDPMMADDCPQGVLQPIYDRINLSSLGSPGFYRRAASACGLTEVAFIDLSPHLTRHYARVLEETKKNEDRIKGEISEAYIEKMKVGLQHWIDGGKNGHLVWGIFHFRKSS
jgi:sarcosine/dimethylglycine N-methyltransferase